MNKENHQFRNQNSRNDNIKKNGEIKQEQVSKRRQGKNKKKKKKQNLIKYHQKMVTRKTITKQKQLCDCLPGKNFNLMPKQSILTSNLESGTKCTQNKYLLKMNEALASVFRRQSIGLHTEWWRV